MLLATTIACLLYAAPAQAQRERVFVASYGSDSNPCTFGSPCKTFQQAINVVADHGEVTAIDSAGFGPVAISHSVTITSPPGIEAGIAPTANIASVQINAGASDVVVLRGLSLEGATVGRLGIAFYSGAGLEIVDCLVRNFASDGIFVGAASGMNVTIVNTRSLDNGAAGVDLEPTPGNNFAVSHISIDHLTATGNNFGVYGNTTTAGEFIGGSLTNSDVDDNISGGVSFTGGAADSTGIIFTIRDTSISNYWNNNFSASSSGIALSASGPSTTITLSRVQIGLSPTPIQINNSAQVMTFGNNDIPGPQFIQGSLSSVSEQ